MSIATLEKDKTWPRKNHHDDILSQSGIMDLVIVGHVQHDLPLLIALDELWDLYCNTFHLPPGDMKVMLLDVYWIWGIPI